MKCTIEAKLKHLLIISVPSTQRQESKQAILWTVAVLRIEPVEQA